MNKKTTISLILFLLIGIISVFAITQGDITITSPANNTWVKEANVTQGFVFVYDTEEDFGAVCTLHVGEYTNPGELRNGTFQSGTNSTTVSGATTTIYMNTTISNNTITYWSIECVNESLPSTSWATGIRAINQDNTTPLYTIDSIGFTNNTWTNSTSARIEVTPIDHYALGQNINVYIYNDTTLVGSGETTNGTGVNVTATLSDGNYTKLKINISDPAKNENVSSDLYLIFVDSTTPAVSQITPTDNEVITINSTIINMSLTEQNPDTIIIDWGGTNVTIDPQTNCTGTAPTYECIYNKTGLTSEADIDYIVYINDSANNLLVYSKTLNVNLEDPVVANTYNLTISDSKMTWKVEVTTANPDLCKANLYNRTGGLERTITGAFSEVGASSANCTGNVTASDVGVEGAFTLEFNVTDDSGTATASSNLSGVYNSISSGWNLISYSGADRNISMICDEIEYCTSVSYYDNEDSSFTTYVTSTPSVNNGTFINAGDAIYVYVSSNSAVLCNDFLPTSGVAENITLYDGGWNVFGLTRASNVSAVHNALDVDFSDQNITWASQYNASASTFYSCSRAADICTGTTINAANLSLVKGEAVWALTDQAYNYTINRTAVLQ